MLQPLRILIIGLSTLDVFVRDVKLPDPDDHAYLKDYKISPGGSAVNMACSLAQLGARVSLCTSLGQDFAGRLVREFLEERGIKLISGGRPANLPTGFSIINVTGGGRMALLHFEGANSAIALDDIPQDDVIEHDIVHVAGAMSMDASDGEPLARFMSRARSAGRLTSLHTSRNTDKRETLFASLPYLDYIFLNQKEAAEITGESEVEKASKWLRGRGVGTVAITLGPRGAHVSNEKFDGAVPGIKTTALDTTGCGDAFAAGFLDSLWRNEDVRDCAAFGNLLGAHCANTLGAVPGPFNRAQLSSLLPDKLNDDTTVNS